MVQTILFVHSSSDLYGSDRCLLRSVRDLRSRSVRSVVCVPYHGPLVEELTALGAVVHVLPLAVMRRSLFTPLGMLTVVRDLFTSVRAIMKIMQAESVDLVHSNTTAVLSGAVAARLLHVPHVWHVREIIIRPVIVRKLISMMVCRLSQTVVGVSKSVIENLARDRPKIGEKARVIYDGIDTSTFGTGDGVAIRREFGIREGAVLVGMLGRVGSWKGQELFLAVAQEVVRSLGDTVFFVAVGSPFMGQEDRFTALKEQVQASGMTGSFILEEFRTDVADILAALDVFVLPSRLPDPFPNTVLEAMAAGKPVVAYAHGGVTEMVADGESGFLVPPNGVIEMANRIRLLAKDKALRETIGEYARKRVKENFDSVVYDAAISELYETLLARQQ